MRKEIIEQIIDRWFELEINKAKELKMKYLIKNSYLKYLCFKLQKKYHESASNFIPDFIVECFKAVKAYEKGNDSVWNQIQYEVQTTDLKANQSELEGSMLLMLSQYVYVSVEGAMRSRQRNKRDGLRVRTGDGENRALVFLNTISLDAVQNEDDNETNLLNLVTAKNNVFRNNSNELYFQSHYGRWFRQNRDRVLKPSQIKFLESVENISIDSSSDEIKEITGTDSRNIDAKFRRIEKKIMEVYNNEKPHRLNSFNQEKMDKIMLIKPILKMIKDDSDLENQNRKIFEYIKLNWDELQYLCIGHLSSEYHQMMTKGIYSTKMIYKLCEVLEGLNSRLEVELAQTVFNHEPSVELDHKMTLKPKLIELPKGTKKAEIIGFDGYCRAIS